MLIKVHISEAIHTKTNAVIWLAPLTERLELKDFKALVWAVKDYTDGYWSRFLSKFVWDSKPPKMEYEFDLDKASVARVVSVKPKIDLSQPMYQAVRKDFLAKEIDAGRIEYSALPDHGDVTPIDEMDWQDALGQKEMLVNIKKRSTNKSASRKITTYMIHGEKVILFLEWVFRYKKIPTVMVEESTQDPKSNSGVFNIVNPIEEQFPGIKKAIIKQNKWGNIGIYHGPKKLYDTGPDTHGLIERLLTKIPDVEEIVNQSELQPIGDDIIDWIGEKGGMTFDAYLEKEKEIEKRLAPLSEKLKTFPKGNMGLTIDRDKPEFIKAKGEFDAVYDELKKFNKSITKEFKKEAQKRRRAQPKQEKDPDESITVKRDGSTSRLIINDTAGDILYSRLLGSHDRTPESEHWLNEPGNAEEKTIIHDDYQFKEVEYSKMPTAELLDNMEECASKDSTQCPPELIDELSRVIRESYFNPALEVLNATASPQGSLDHWQSQMGTLLSDSETNIIVAFSGGKDSVCLVLKLLDMGIPAERIELWHHDIDGVHQNQDGTETGEHLMDWECTPSYCEAFAKHFGMRLLFSYRKGGIVNEILKKNKTIESVLYQTEPGGPFYELHPSAQAKVNSRMRFPAVSGDLMSRWCSGYVKIDVMAKVINNQPRFKTGKLVVLTGERRAESGKRATYLEIEKYRSHTKSRTALVWRALIDLSHAEIWDMMERYKIQPHPAYMLGFGRTSCQLCIFNMKNAWATQNEISPHRIKRIIEIENECVEYWKTQPDSNFTGTLYPKKTIDEMVESGESWLGDMDTEYRNHWINQANGKYTAPIIVEGDWKKPIGATSSENCGAS